jgi:hypothetical protein
MNSEQRSFALGNADQSRGVGQVTIDMSYYLDKILREFKGLKPETLLEKKNLFLSNAESPLLSKLERHSFHTVTLLLQNGCICLAEQE